MSVINRADRVAMTCTMNAGLGAYPLGSALDTYSAFSGNATNYKYIVEECDANGTPIVGGKWETNEGVYTSSGTSLSRARFVGSSTGSAINWTNPTTLRIRSTALAEDFPSTGGGVFGDGSDGALVYDGSTTILGMAPSSNIYTLTRDIWATTLTVNTGVTIITAGFRIFCTGLLSCVGTIHNNGTAGTAGASGSAGTGGAAGLTGQTWGSDGTGGVAVTAGGNGNRITTATTANGSNVTGSASGNSLGGGGGTGGNTNTSTGTGTGGTGGTITAPTSVQSKPRNNPEALTGTRCVANAVAAYRFGSGGGGGSVSQTSVGTASSGGGGGTGSIVCIASRQINNTGTISANGGVGGNGFCSGLLNQAASGGGGGGGGVVILIYAEFSGNAATANGGGAGTSATFGTGTIPVASTAGAAGTVITIRA